jgi:hypothetical protein
MKARDLLRNAGPAHRAAQPARSLGAAAVGALATGAGAVGALAIARLVIGRARIRALKIEVLEVTRLRVQSLELASGPGLGGHLRAAARVAPFRGLMAPARWHTSCGAQAMRIEWEVCRDGNVALGPVS